MDGEGNGNRPCKIKHKLDPNLIPLLFSAANFDINMQDEESGETFLHIAVSMRDAVVTNVLLNANASVNVEDNAGNSPITLAMDTECLEILESLLKHNPDFNKRALRDKFFNRLINSVAPVYKHMVKLMVQYGFTVLPTDEITSGMMLDCILNCHEEMAIQLVNAKKDFLKSIDTWYRSFLLHIQPLAKDQSEMVRILKKIRHQFMPEASLKTTGNHNADLFRLLLSVEQHLDIMNVIIMSNGESLDADSPLAIVNFHKQVLRFCYHSEEPLCDEIGRTGLHYAAKVGNVGLIHALLDMHLDVNAKDKDGKTPLDYTIDRIKEYSSHNSETGDNDNIDDLHETKHHDEEFNCYFSLMELKIGAVVFLRHILKLMNAKCHIGLENLNAVEFLIPIMGEEQIAFYYISSYKFAQECESELKIMKKKKLGGLSYHDFLTKNSERMSFFTKREEVIEALVLSDKVLEQFEIYGPMLQRRFHVCNLRRGLLERTELVLFEIMKCLQLPLVSVRKILSNFSNEELFFMAINS